MQEQSEKIRSAGVSDAKDEAAPPNPADGAGAQTNGAENKDDMGGDQAPPLPDPGKKTPEEMNLSPQDYLGDKVDQKTYKDMAGEKPEQNNSEEVQPPNQEGKDGLGTGQPENTADPKPIGSRTESRSLAEVSKELKEAGVREIHFASPGQEVHSEQMYKGKAITVMRESSCYCVYIDGEKHKSTFSSPKQAVESAKQAIDGK